MQGLNETLEILDQQYGDYQAMLALGLEQRICIQAENLAGLDASLANMHQLIERIRRRQSGLSRLDQKHPEVAIRCERLRDIIREIQDLRDYNQRSVQRLREDAREEIRRLDRGRQAARGYKDIRVTRARLFDGTR